MSKSSCDDDASNFHIIKPGKEVNGFKLLKVLGIGVHGSVVSAFDTQENKLVAIKISRGTPEERDGVRQEAMMLQYLHARTDFTTVRCLANMRKSFEFGRHSCIVFDVLGKPLAAFLVENAFRPFPRSQVQNLARQLFSGVAFLHENNIIHTDLKLDNILLVEDEYDEITVTKNRDEDAHYLPYGTTYAMVTDEPWRILRKTAVRIIDFGLAVYNTKGKVYYHLIQALDYRAPEVCLGLAWDFSADVYALGFIIGELRCGYMQIYSDDDFQRLCAMHAFFGPIPQSLAAAGVKMHREYFIEQDGQLEIAWRTCYNEKEFQIFVERRKTFDKLVKNIRSDRALKRLLDQVLDYDPVKRISAKGALSHEYLVVDVPYNRSTL